MATFNISNQSHKDYITRHREVGARLADLEKKRISLASGVLIREAQRDIVGSRVREGLVNEIAALDSLLESQLTNAFAQVAAQGSTDVIAFYTNADADAAIASGLPGLW